MKTNVAEADGRLHSASARLAWFLAKHRERADDLVKTPSSGDAAHQFRADQSDA
jgi:hypothetical protein